jgi:L-threonylcarbamoyladenylate synthase
MFFDLTSIITTATQGDLICLPTDTVPGLAVRPDRGELIYQFKGRSNSKPLILLGADVEALVPFLVEDAVAMKAWRSMMDWGWPGALTLVLPCCDRVPPALRTNGFLGIRVPGLPIAREILARTGPLATTSVNRSGEPALRDPRAIEATFPNLSILDPIHSGPWPTDTEPSTIIQWHDSRWQILRQGSIEIPL